jgi:hypothetical protein
MSRRTLICVRVGWVVAVLALMAAWQEEALVLLLPLALVGPLLREVVPAADADERQRHEDYRASHVALMSVYALLFLIVAKQQLVDGTPLAADWILVFVLPLLVRTALSMGRGVGRQRLGITVALATGTAWLGFAVISHGLSWGTLAEGTIGGVMLLGAWLARRRPRLGGGLLGLLSLGLLAAVGREAIGSGRWELGLTLLALLVLPAFLASASLLAAAPEERGAGDEFADLRAAAAGPATLPPPPHRPRPWPRAWLGMATAATLFAACAAVVGAFASAPAAPAAAAATGPRKERLKVPRDIDGVPCAVRAFYRADGRLESCTLSRDHVFPNGLTLPEGTRVGLDEAGLPATAFLPRVTAFDGHRCFGDGTHNPMTNFHPNGRLRFCNLAEPETIQGLPCAKSTFWTWMRHGNAGVYFHDNGGLRECLLAGDVTFEGRALRKGAHVVLDADGQVVDAPSR